MRIVYNDYETPCDSFEYNHEENAFLLFDSEKKLISQYSSVLKLDAEYDYKNFYYQIMHNDRQDYSENSIYQVYVNGLRIGWIFPFQALISNEHDFSENVYFLKYAYVANCLLLDSINEAGCRECSPDFMINDYYDDNISILVIDKENTSKISDFNLDDYIVSLYKYGYSYNGCGNLSSETIEIDKRLNLKPIAEYLRNIEYIKNIFKNELPQKREPFAMFHMLYQLIEIMISLIFTDKFKKFIKDLENDNSLLFEQKDELNKVSNEKQRVKWLFSEYVQINASDASYLNGKCRQLLIDNEKKYSDDVSENLYLVRCLLVHNMYILNDPSHELVNEINNTFLDVVIDMIISFRIANK